LCIAIGALREHIFAFADRSRNVPFCERAALNEMRLDEPEVLFRPARNLREDIRGLLVAELIALSIAWWTDQD
jgi:hypothetical protein